MNQAPLKAFALVCTLTPSPAASSTQLLTEHLFAEFEKHQVVTELARAVDYNIKPGVLTDMGDGDDWPMLRQKMLEADIFILATPTWAGHTSSVAARVIERLDAELSEMDDDGKPLVYDKVANAVIVGNEDGAHHITAEIFQALNDYGFTIPASGATYWNGEAMHGTDYKDLSETPDVVSLTNRKLAAASVHLAQALRNNPYPVPPS